MNNDDKLEEFDIFDKTKKFLSENTPKYWGRRLLKEEQLYKELKEIFPSYTHNEIPHIVKFGYRKEPRCVLCGKVVNIRAEKVNTTCGYSCSAKLSIQNGRLEKTKKTNLERYGVDYPLRTTEVKEKRKKTNLERYGVENVSNVVTVQEKRKQTNNERYGVDSTFHHIPTKEKIIKTNIERYGVEYPTSSIEIKERRKQTNIERYGVENVSNSIEIKERRKQTNIERYGVEYNSQSNMSPFAYSTLTNKELLEKFIKGKTAEDISEELSITKSTLYSWIRKHQIAHEMKSGANISSSKEAQVCDFFDESNVTYEKNIRSIISPKEIDIWLPVYNIGFEIHGLYWHGEAMKKENKTLHIDKHNMAKEKNIKLYQLFEDEIDYKFDIVKSMILSKLGKIENKYYARKTEIREISWKEAKVFLDENHIQGQGKAGTYNIGLYHNDELVSIVVFGKLRPSLGSKSIDGHFELYRFCNKLNTTTVGGFDKLFKHFINNYSPIKIISYSDKRLFSGEVYEKSGFINDGESLPGYWYVKNDKRIHRYNFTKQKLIEQGHNPNKTEWEIMQELGYDRIWDCGNSKWVWTKN